MWSIVGLIGIHIILFPKGQKCKDETGELFALRRHTLQYLSTENTSDTELWIWTILHLTDFTKHNGRRVWAFLPALRRFVCLNQSWTLNHDTYCWVTPSLEQTTLRATCIYSRESLNRRSAILGCVVIVFVFILCSGDSQSFVVFFRDTLPRRKHERIGWNLFVFRTPNTVFLNVSASCRNNISHALNQSVSYWDFQESSHDSSDRIARIPRHRLENRHEKPANLLHSHWKSKIFIYVLGTTALIK